MLLHKWCPFLIRRMSPLRLGLICFCLIGVSPLSFHSQNYSIHPTASAAVKLKKNAIHSSSAKDFLLFHRTKPPTEAPRSSFKVSSASRPEINNGASTDIDARNKRIPKLNLSLRLKVRNGSETNSTIVYLPRLGRLMTNLSRNSVNNSLQPVIVSSRRRVLLDPKEYKIRPTASDLRESPKLNSTSSQFGRKLNRTNSTSIDRRKFGSRPPESSSKIKETISHNNRKVFNTGISNDQPFSESTVLVNIKRIGSNTKRNSTVLQFLPTNSSRNQYNRKFPQLYRRQGRNFDTTNFDSKENDETISEELISLPAYNNRTTIRTVSKNAEVRKIPLTSIHHILEPNRAPLFPQDVTSSERREDKNLTDLGYSYTEKKANNITIYEILKPRLKSSSNISEIIDFSPDQNSFSLQNDAAFHQIKDIENGDSSNSSSVTDMEETNNTTLVTNVIEYETSDDRSDSTSISPDWIDSSFGIKYVVVNRSNFTLYPLYPSYSNETSLDVNLSDSFSTEDPKTEDSITNSDTVDDLKVEVNTTEVFTENISRGQNNEAVYLIEATNNTKRHNNSVENTSADGSEYLTSLYESDSIRRPKMTENIHSNNTPYKNTKIDSKMFYDYFAKRPIGNGTLRDFPYIEYRPGNMFRYSDIYQRKPILDVAYTRPTPILRTAKTEAVTEEAEQNPTTFNSLRTSVRVMSTYYPNRMQDVTMKFGNRIESTTVSNFAFGDKRPGYRNEDDPDDAEYRDAIDTGFTMEKLAYLLIGTCCGLSILCLFIVVIAIKCRRVIVEKRLKAQFRKRMYHHERMKDMASPWQQQMFDHFMYLNRRPEDSSCSSNTDSCNCRCVTWSLGPRNLDTTTRPLCPTSRNSLYLYGQKKLPFGAASTLRFESMLGRKRSSPDNNNHQKRGSPNTDSSHENDSLDLDSDSREGDGPKQCTCIDYNVWPMPPTNVPRGFFTLCPNPGRYNQGNCSQHPAVEIRTIARDVPPPVTGSNYLDRSEGVVYWSSNEERLI